jgi:dihydropteroate synthase
MKRADFMFNLASDGNKSTSAPVFKAGKYELPLGKKTYIMGILNVTPDSFSDGGKWTDAKKAVARAIEIQSEGADILDIGAQSTRPGYTKITAQEEWERLEPVLRELRGKLTIPISVDTFYSRVAESAVQMGVDVINDVYGFSDKGMYEVMRKNDCGCIITCGMEDKLTDKYYVSAEGAEKTDYGVSRIKFFFKNRLSRLRELGINKDRVCFDPGIGFAKAHEEDLYILGNIQNFKIKGNAMAVGVSRKRVIGFSCGNPPFDQRVYGTIAANVIAGVLGADILRVHDVAETVQAVKVADKIIKTSVK